MMRQGNFFRCGRWAAAIAALWAVHFAAQVAIGQGLIYTDANELPEFGTVNVAPTTAFKSNLPVVDNDNLWNFRDFGANTTVYQSGVTEDSPMLTQTVSGLTPGTSYDLYAVYWTDDDENWTIRTGTSAGSLTNYSWTGAGGSFPVPGSLHGLSASAAVWTTPPPPTKVGTTFLEARPASTEPFMDPLVMLLAKAGTATANGAGQIDVFVDDNPSIGAARRNWFDGIAYAPADTPVAVTASLDRTTGALSLANPTGQAFQIKAIHVESPTTGALNAVTWSKVSTANPSWNVTMPADPANTPFTNILAEDGAGNSIILAANGGSLSFGNAWNKSPFDHIRIFLTLADDSIAELSPTLTGPAIANSDLDANGVSDLADFQTFLSNLHTMPGLPTRVENFRRGELTGDANVNFNDWAVFRAAYNEANGAGAFEAMLAQIPEPSSMALLAIAISLPFVWLRRRTAACGLVAILCFTSTNTTTAATLLKVDVDARAGDSTAGPPGPNTVDGFSSYTLEAGTTGGLGTSTGMVNGYTITLTAVDAAGVPTGVFDDRDRAIPDTAPMLNQLYDDFIFANVSAPPGGTGEGGGLDMTVSGGALMPNTQYGVSIYSYDTSSAGLRTANWLDGNSNNDVALLTTFDGSVSRPTMDDQYKFSGVFTTDASGSLLLRARETAAASHGVFINGFEITDELPPPPILLTLRVNTTTGMVSIVNEQATSIDMSYYELRSAAGALNLAGWNSLDDAEGGDPEGTGWDEVPASNANLLSEVNLESMTTLAQGNSVSLGNVFTIGGAEDLQLLYAGPSETLLHSATVSYITGPGGVSGDYNGDNKVDAADYVIWRKTDGTMTTLPNDLTPGTVDDGDYNVWRANFGKSAPAGAALASATTVPEPATIVFAVLLLPVGLQFLRKARKRISYLN